MPEPQQQYKSFNDWAAKNSGPTNSRSPQGVTGKATASPQGFKSFNDWAASDPFKGATGYIGDRPPGYFDPGGFLTSPANLSTLESTLASYDFNVHGRRTDGSVDDPVRAELKKRLSEYSDLDGQPLSFDKLPPAVVQQVYKEALGKSEQVIRNRRVAPGTWNASTIDDSDRLSGSTGVQQLMGVVDLAVLGKPGFGTSDFKGRKEIKALFEAGDWEEGSRRTLNVLNARFGFEEARKRAQESGLDVLPLSPKDERRIRSMQGVVEDPFSPERVMGFDLKGFDEKSGFKFERVPVGEGLSRLINEATPFTASPDQTSLEVATQNIHSVPQVLRKGWAQAIDAGTFAAKNAGLPVEHLPLASQENIRSIEKIAGENRATKAADQGARLLQYMVPVLGQATIGADAIDVARQATTEGLPAALEEFVTGTIKGANPFEPGIYPEERVIRAITGALLVYGAKHGIDKMRGRYESLKLGQELGIPVTQSGPILQLLKQTVRATPDLRWLEDGSKPPKNFKEVLSDPQKGLKERQQAIRQVIDDVPEEAKAQLAAELDLINAQLSAPAHFESRLEPMDLQPRQVNPRTIDPQISDPMRVGEPEVPQFIRPTEVAEVQPIKPAMPDWLRPQPEQPHLSTVQPHTEPPLTVIDEAGRAASAKERLQSLGIKADYNPDYLKLQENRAAGVTSEARPFVDRIYGPEDLQSSLRSKFGYTDEQAKATTQIAQAMADTWAEYTGRSNRDWWSSRFYGLGRADDVLPDGAPNPGKRLNQGAYEVRHELLGSHHGQKDLRALAVDPETGTFIGGVDYTIYEGEASIRHVEVLPEYRRQGVATQLYDSIKSENPGTPIKTFGTFQTPEGQAFRTAYDRRSAELQSKDVRRNPYFQRWFGESKVVDDQGQPVTAYHGTARPDRIGARFQKNRATSGPMAFFTESPDIASNYSLHKADTSLAYEDTGSYSDWFKVKPKGSKREVSIEDYWYHLSTQERQQILDRLPHVGFEDPEMGEGRIVGNSRSITGKDHIDLLTRESRGNGLKAAVELWLNSATLIHSEHEFLDVLNALGIKGVRMDDPRAEKSGVYPVYLKIERPLDTSNIPDSLVDILDTASRTRRKKQDVGSDWWDKNTREPRQWVEELRKDQENGTSHAWTSIPDWVTETLKKLGYDGIKDTGGKFTGSYHTVWIPFEPNQIKSIFNRGKFSESPNILKQGPKASIEFLETEQALIRALDNPDPSSAVHELGHLARRELYRDEIFTAEERRAVEDWAGVTNGRWDTPAEERFARGWERYLASGKAPTQILQQAFERMKEWLLSVYRNIVGSAIDVQVSPEVQAVFDKMLGGELEARRLADEAAALKEAASAKQLTDDLMKIDPEDPRLDPYADEFEEPLVNQIKEVLGSGLEYEQRSAGRIIQDAWEKLDDQQLREQEHYTNKKSAIYTDIIEHLEHGLKGTAGHGWVRWYKRGGQWTPDKRPTQYVGGISAELPDNVIEGIRRFVETEWNDPEYMLVDPRNREVVPGQYTRLKGAKTVSEMFWENDGSPGDQIIPTPIVQAYVDSLKRSQRLYQDSQPGPGEKMPWRYMPKEQFQTALEDIAVYSAEEFKAVPPDVQRRNIEQTFKLNGTQSAQVMKRVSEIRAIPRINEIWETSTKAEISSMLAQEFPGIPKVRHQAAMTRARQAVGASTGRMYDYQPLKPEYSWNLAADLLDAADIEKAGFGDGLKAIERSIGQKLVEVRDYVEAFGHQTSDLTDLSFEQATTDPGRAMAAEKYWKSGGTAIDELRLIPSIHPLSEKQFTPLVREEYGKLATLILQTLNGDKGVTAKFLKHLGLSTDMVRSTMKVVDENLAANQINKIWTSTEGQFGRTSEAMAKELPGIARTRHNYAITMARKMADEPLLTRPVYEFRKGRTDRRFDTGRRVAVVGGRQVTVPQDMLTDLYHQVEHAFSDRKVPKGPAINPRRLLPNMWDESRYIEHVSNRNKWLHEWTVEHRQQAVTDLTNEMLSYKQRMKEQLGPLVSDPQARQLIMLYAERKLKPNGVTEAEWLADRDRLNLESLKRGRPDDWQAIKSSAEWFKGEYDELFKRLTDLSQTFGTPEPLYRQDYFTHIVEEASAWDHLFAGDMTGGSVGDYRRNAPSNQFLKRRVTDKTQYDAVLNFEEYLKPTLAQLHLTEPAIRRRVLAKALREQTMEGDIQTLANYLDSMADVLTTRKTGDKPTSLRTQTDNFLMSALDWVTHRTASNKIVGNMRSALMQTSAIPIATPLTGFGNMARGSMMNLMAVTGRTPDLIERSQFMQRRYPYKVGETSSLISPTVQLKGGQIKEGLVKGGEQLAVIPMEAVERSSARIVWYANYLKALEPFDAQVKGLKGRTDEMATAEMAAIEDRAIQQADKMTERIISGRAIGEKPPAFYTWWGRIGFQFQLEVNNFVQLYWHDLPFDEATGQQVTIGTALKRHSELMLSLYLANTVYQSMFNDRPLPDPIQAGFDMMEIDDKDPWKIFGKRFGRMVGEALSSVPGGSQIAGVLPETNVLGTGMTRKEILGRTSAGSFANDGTAISATIRQTLSGSDFGEWLFNVFTELGMPYGGAQLRKTVRGLEVASTGQMETRTKDGTEGRVKFETSDPLDPARALIFGPYSTTGGKRYTDSLGQPKDDERKPAYSGSRSSAFGSAYKSPY